MTPIERCTEHPVKNGAVIDLKTEFLEGPSARLAQGLVMVLALSMFRWRDLGFGLGQNQTEGSWYSTCRGCDNLPQCRGDVYSLGCILFQRPVLYGLDMAREPQIFAGTDIGGIVLS